MPKRSNLALLVKSNKDKLLEHPLALEIDRNLESNGINIPAVKTTEQDSVTWRFSTSDQHTVVLRIYQHEDAQTYLLLEVGFGLVDLAESAEIEKYFVQQVSTLATPIRLTFCETICVAQFRSDCRYIKPEFIGCLIEEAMSLGSHAKDALLDTEGFQQLPSEWFLKKENVH